MTISSENLTRFQSLLKTLFCLYLYLKPNTTPVSTWNLKLSPSLCLKPNGQSKYKPVNLSLCPRSSLRIVGVPVTVLVVLEAPSAGSLGPQCHQDDQDKKDSNQDSSNNPSDGAAFQSISVKKSQNWKSFNLYNIISGAEIYNPII